MSTFARLPDPRLLVALVLIPWFTLQSPAASQVVAWGANSQGQTNVPASLTNTIALAAGLYHSLALKADGTVVAWGGNAYGQTNVPAGLTEVVAVSAGNSHSLALRDNGTVVGWGHNAYGQARAPAGLTNVVAIAAGYFHNLALKADGTVVAWGKNDDIAGDPVGQTNVPAGLENVIAIAGGTYYSLALKADGTLVAWGNLTPLASTTNITAISTAGDHGLALNAKGEVMEWGLLVGIGKLAPPTNVVAIAAGGYHGLGLRPDGTVTGWGAGTSVTNLFPFPQPGPPNFGQSTIPANLTKVTAVAAGGYHSLALIGDGAPVLTTAMVDRTIPLGLTVHFRIVATGATPLHYQWRFNDTDISGATNAVLTLPHARFDQAGQYSVMVSNRFGTVLSPPATLRVVPLMISTHPRSQSTCQSDTVRFGVTIAGVGPFRYQWRFNGVDLPNATNGMLVLNNLRLEQSGLYSVTVANAAGLAVSQGAALSVSAVMAWGINEFGQTNLPFWLTNVTAIAAGDYHSAALKADGTVVAWGENSVASAITGQTNVPPGLSNVVALAAGARHTLALKADGTVVGWGQVTVPSGLAEVKALAASWHSLALKSNHTVVAWGFNTYGQANVPAGLSNVVAVAAGISHSLALKTDGTVQAWGDDGWGESQIPPGLSNVVAIAAGFQHSAALRGDGTLAVWGAGYAGQTNLPVGLTNVVAIAAGGHHTLALQRDGRLVTFGDNSATSALRVPLAVTNPMAFSAGAGHNLALLGAGPAIVVQPEDQKITEGSNVTFLVVATGTPALSYQWHKDGVEIQGATEATLRLPNVQYHAAGSYFVRVTNHFGASTSVAARLTVNRLPVADASATQTRIISQNGTNATVVLDGSRSYDPDSDPLFYHWFEDQPTNQLAAGAVALVRLPIGVHAISLTVDDGMVSVHQDITVEIITIETAIERLIAEVKTHTRHVQPLLATLSAAASSAARGAAASAIHQLQAFKIQVAAQVAPQDAALAASLQQTADVIIDLLDRGYGDVHRRLKLIRMAPDSRTRLQFMAIPGRTYVVEASSNLVDWEKIGVARETGSGEYQFEDPKTDRFGSRYYRLVVPVNR